jgi:hypothetical protein
MAGSPDARRGRPNAAAPAKGDAASQKLAEHLHQIATEAPAPEDALEPALRAILEACGATAGAICLFDQRNEMLRLAAEVGLSDEGCRQLRSVRRGGVGTWDMPLHSLLNRRAYLIESAARNRYVPPLVEPAASVRTLACVPLYAGSTPLASLILVAMIPASFSERDIRVLDQAIRELVKMIESVRRRAPGQSPEPAHEAPPPPAPVPEIVSRRPQTRATVSPELSMTPTVPEPPSTSPADSHATTEMLATALAESERERTRLATALEQATARAAGVTPSDELTRALQAVEAAEAAHATAAAEAEVARVEATRCRAEIQRLETSEREHAETRAHLEQQVAEATARGAAYDGTRAQLDAELADARAKAARLDEVSRERDALAAERDRLHEAAQSAGEAEAARAELAHARTSLDTVTAEVERLRAEITALTAATEAARAEQSRLESELAAERSRSTERTTELEQQLAALHSERDADAARIAELSAAHDADAAQIADLVAERDTLREAAARASEAEAAQAALSAAQSTIDRLHGELEQVRTDVEQLTTAERNARDALAHAAQEALEVRTRMEQEAAEALARERAALEEQLTALRSERDHAAMAIGAEREDAAREREALREQLTALESRLADVTAASEAAAGAAAAADAAREELAVLQATIDELRSEGANARGELERLATVERDLLADRSRLEQSLAEAQDTATAAPSPDETPADEIEGEAVLTMEPPPEELATVETTASEPEAAQPGAEAPETPAAGGEQASRLVILDEDAAWDGLACDAYQVTRLAPDADTVSRIVAMAPQRLIVNLAVSGALETVFQLRGAGVTGRCWGHVAAAGAPTVLPLSQIDASHRPLDPDAMIGTMAPHAAQGTRVVMVGADVDALISLRQALARQGLSVSMAWNAKQADDLLGMVKPQLAVVDLDLPQRDGYGIVAKLAAMSPVPTMVLVQGVEDSGGRFAALLTDPSHRERMTKREQMLSTVASWQEPATKEKRGGKVRTLPR